MLHFLNYGDKKSDVPHFPFSSLFFLVPYSNDICDSVMQEPFKNVPLVWTINELTLASRLKQYISSGQNDFVDNWRKVFSRANVVVFPNYILPVLFFIKDRSLLCIDMSLVSMHVEILKILGET